MSGTKHTPGPWKDGTTAHTRAKVYANGLCVAHIRPIHAEGSRQVGDFDTEEANARLIAAAPDLLDALRECITDDGARCLAYGTDTPALRARIASISTIARAAIAQAEMEG